MSLMDMLFGRKPKTAAVARDRLQIIIAQERAQEGQAPDYLPTLRKELLEVLSKYVNVSLDAPQEPSPLRRSRSPHRALIGGQFFLL